MEVVIEPWPSAAQYWAVGSGSTQLGCISGQQTEYVFHRYRTYESLEGSDKSLVEKAVSDFIILLNITKRLTS